MDAEARSALEETIMITYRPIAPLTVGSGTLHSILAAMAAAAFLGTAAFGAEATTQAGTEVRA